MNTKTGLYWVLAIGGYVCGSATLVYLFGFTNNWFVPKGIDGGAPAGLGAIPFNLALVAIFGLQHSVMSRPSFKAVWTRIVPPPVERAIYLLATSAALGLLMWLWQPIPGHVWQVESAFPRLALQALYVTGWMIAVGASFNIDHLELFGLRQVIRHSRALPPSSPDFAARWLYAIVRHPIILGWFIIVWATPDMTVGHLVFAVSLSTYNLIATYFEERNLIESIGPRYERYKQKVPAFIPGIKSTVQADGSNREQV